MIRGIIGIFNLVSSSVTAAGTNECINFESKAMRMTFKIDRALTSWTIKFGFVSANLLKKPASETKSRLRKVGNVVAKSLASVKMVSMVISLGGCPDPEVQVMIWILSMIRPAPMLG